MHLKVLVRHAVSLRSAPSPRRLPFASWLQMVVSSFSCSGISTGDFNPIYNVPMQGTHKAEEPTPISPLFGFGLDPAAARAMTFCKKMKKYTLVLLSVAILMLGSTGCDSEPGVERTSKTEKAAKSKLDLSGRAKFHVTTSGGVAGVWNPETKKAEFHVTTSGGVAGVFVPNNPGDYQLYLHSMNSN